MFEINNIGQVVSQIEAWEAEVYESTRRAVMGVSIKMLHHVVEKSAQYSGDFAANWNIQRNSVDTHFEPSVLVQRSKSWDGTLRHGMGPAFQPKIMGDPAAKTYALSANAGRLNGFQLGEDLWISNSAAHDEPYAWKIEEGSIKFRPGNRGAPVAQAFDMVRTQYSTIGPSELSRLRRMAL